MNNIIHNLAQVQRRIAKAVVCCGRSLKEIKLLAVSKTKSIDTIKKAIEAGQLEFGENYVQEGMEKILFFKEKGVIGLQWHFIGSLQSNKSRFVSEYFDWCHTIDRLQIAARLNKYRPKWMIPLNVLIQVNLEKEKNKSGIPLSELYFLANELTNLTHLKLRGLMIIPSKKTNYEQQLSTAKQAAMIFKKFKVHYPTVDTLSFGMSDDMEAAIVAGSTMVRIGTAIFGPRKLHENKQIDKI